MDNNETTEWTLVRLDLTALSSACNYANCQAGAIATGTFPCDINIPLASRFVSPLSQRYEERARSHRDFLRNGININSRLITDDDFLAELNANLTRRGNPEYCLLQDIAYAEAIEMIKSINENSCCLLSRFPKYVGDDGSIIA